MFHSFVAILMSVGLGTGFGEGTAEVVSIDSDSMLVAVEIEAAASADSVVASFLVPGDDPVTIPLIQRGGNLFGVQTELRPVDYTVVFEILGPEPAQSDRVTLSAMGADFGNQPVVTIPPAEEEEDDGFSTNAKRWGWLALALAAASLAVLAFWVLGGRDRDADANRDEETDASRGDDPSGEPR